MKQARVLGEKAVCFGLHRCFWAVTLGENNIVCPAFISSKTGKSTQTWLVIALGIWEGLLLRGFPANALTQGQAFLSVDFCFCLLCFEKPSAWFFMLENCGFPCLTQTGPAG